MKAASGWRGALGVGLLVGLWFAAVQLSLVSLLSALLPFALEIPAKVLRIGRGP